MITWTKLKSGQWGLRGAGLVSGATVDVVKRDGTSKTVTVGVVVWSGVGADGKPVALATVAAPPGPSTTPRQGGGGGGGGGGGCHTGGDCSSLCSPRTCPCGDGSWFRCC